MSKASCPAQPAEHAFLRVWRPAGIAGVVAVRCRTNGYQAEPHGEYVFGHVAERSVRVERGRDRYLFRPGDIGLWDPSGPHRGVAVDGGYWESHAVVVELPYAADVITDPDGCTLDVAFPNPLLRDPARAASFLRLHRALSGPAPTLEQEAALARWLHQVTQLAPAAEQRQWRERRRSARRDPALRRACELLADDLARDVELAALAEAAGTSKYRVLRLFKVGLGLPPHTYQIQLRVQRARTLLEAGHTVAAAAHSVGFFDQSHLSRHFQRRIGVTPGRYAQSFDADRDLPAEQTSAPAERRRTA